jgi:hypothetical protein
LSPAAFQAEHDVVQFVDGGMHGLALLAIWPGILSTWEPVYEGGELGGAVLVLPQ